MRKLKKIYIEITNACNKSCSFCHGTKRPPRFMNEAEFSHILNEAIGVSEYLYFHVLGEPLCHPDVYKFISLAYERGFKVTITTNGTLLSPQLLESNIYKLQISLHSFENGSRESHARYIANIADFAKNAAKRNVLVSLRLWNLESENDNTFAEAELKRAFSEQWHECRDGSFKLSESIYLNYAKRFDWPDINDKECNTNLFCYGLRDQIAILSDGTVVPCCLDADGEIPLGNIFKAPLTEILVSSRAEGLYNSFSLRKPVEALCKRCKYAKRFN